MLPYNRLQFIGAIGRAVGRRFLKESSQNLPSPQSFRYNTVMVLPLFKLGTLAVRTLAKPVAKRIKDEAGVSPKFRQFIINMAQANHRLTTTMQRRIYGHATDVAIRPLNENRAVQDATELLGELFVFAVAGAAIIFEVQRNARSEARKEELRKKETEAERLKQEELAKEVELLKRKIEQLERLAHGQGAASGFFNLWRRAETGQLGTATAA